VEHTDVYRTREWFESLAWQHHWIEKMAGWWAGEFGLPEMVCDYGAGDGWWCKSFAEMGSLTYGVELDEIAREFMPPVVQAVIRDLREPITDSGRFDLVICLEVAEHMTEIDAKNALIPTLVKSTGNLLLFSAARPEQPGTGHINLQPPDYWINLIEKWQVVQYSQQKTEKAAQAFRNITNECFEFLPNNLLVFAKVT